jgi:hypothetical protein
MRNGLVFIMVLLSCCLFRATPAIAATDDSAPPAGEVEVAVETQTFDGATPYATNYRAVHDGCTVTWIAYRNEPGVVKYAADCPAPLAAQLPLLRAVCAAYLEQDPGAAAFRTLFWGRLAPDDPTSSREMSFRLAAAAFASPGWDRVRGKPKQGDINRFARDLANQAGIYAELTELFAPFHRAVTLGTVEKVLVVPAGDLPFFPELRKLGVRAADRLPYDGMAWFAVTATAGP